MSRPRLLELFSGTGSIGRAFEAKGWDVVSVDLRADFNPTIVADIMTWDYTTLPRDHFNMLWGSPVCTHYSRARTRARTPRDLEGSDAMVQRTIDIFNYFVGAEYWGFENPRSGLLPNRPVVQGLAYKDITYCRYGFRYQKPTRIWVSEPLSQRWNPKPPCTFANPCDCLVVVREGNRTRRFHPESAQRGPSKRQQKDGQESRHSQEQLYSMPPELCDELAASVTQALEELD